MAVAVGGGGGGGGSSGGVSWCVRERTDSELPTAHGYLVSVIRLILHGLMA